MAYTPTSIPAFPLKWPSGVPRTAAHQIARSRFGKVAWNNALQKLHHKLALLGARHVTISTNQKIRQDGMPYAQQIQIDDAGVAVYFTLDGEQLCLPCDRWGTIAENIQAINKHVEAMSGQQRWGVGTVKQAFSGYKALTATAGQHEDWWFVLGVLSAATAEQVRAAHRVLALKAHPDAGGSADQMARINIARDRALAEIGAR